MNKFLFWISLASMFVWAFVRLNNYLLFEKAITHPLEHVAQATTVEEAARDLSVVLARLKERGMDNGSTAIFVKTPSDDLALWYSKLETTRANLEAAATNASNEVLTSQGTLAEMRRVLSNEKVKVFIPFGVTTFPNNGLFALWIWMSILIFVITGLRWFTAESEPDPQSYEARGWSTTS